MARLDTEREFHDRQAQRRAASFVEPASLCFNSDDYLDHETWIRPAFNLLALRPGQRFLDFGCGHGMASVVADRMGANVTAFDLSAGYVREANRRALANHSAVRLVQADGHRLPFADGSFDRIWGNAVLHHLDVRGTALEIRRVLAVDGVAVFCEPWNVNPLLRWCRRRMRYAGKDRTPDEEAWSPRQLDELQRVFGRVDAQGFQLLAMVRRVLPGRPMVRTLEVCDRWLLHGLPFLGNLCRYMVVRLRV